MAFSDLDGQAYMTTYYQDATEGEVSQQLAFMVEAGKDLKVGASVLDLASGPTVYQAAPACRTASSIILTDMSAELLGHAERWRDGKADAFDWDPWIKKVLEIEAAQGIQSGDGLAERKEKMRKAIDFAVVDIQKKQPWTFNHQFDLVQSLFLASCAATSNDDFVKVWKKCVDYVAPGGDLILVEVCDASYYTVGKSKVYAHCVDYDNQVKYLEELGCKFVSKMFVAGDDVSHGYSGLAMFHLKKPDA